MQTETIGKSKAAVPIPIYRELAAELQSAQTKIMHLQNQNDRLVQQNQVLLEELEALLQMHTHAQTSLAGVHQQMHATGTEARQRIAQVMAPQVPEKVEVVLEEADIPPTPRSLQRAQVVPPTLETIERSPLNRGWLFLMLVTILLICFGVGFAVVLTGKKR